MEKACSGLSAVQALVFPSKAWKNVEFFLMATNSLTFLPLREPWGCSALGGLTALTNRMSQIHIMYCLRLCGKTHAAPTWFLWNACSPSGCFFPEPSCLAERSPSHRKGPCVGIWSIIAAEPSLRLIPDQTQTWEWTLCQVIPAYLPPFQSSELRSQTSWYQAAEISHPLTESGSIIKWWFHTPKLGGVCYPA